MTDSAVSIWESLRLCPHIRFLRSSISQRWLHCEKPTMPRSQRAVCPARMVAAGLGDKNRGTNRIRALHLFSPRAATEKIYLISALLEFRCCHRVWRMNLVAQIFTGLIHCLAAYRTRHGFFHHQLRKPARRSEERRVGKEGRS